MNEAERMRLAKIKADPASIKEEMRRILEQDPGTPIWDRDSATQQTYYGLRDALETHASITEPR